nr:head GIN domain-containing protein [uncultured Sphingosinicella sp.]
MPLAFIALLGHPASAAERRYTITDFDRIHVEGPFQVTLVTGKGVSALATGDTQALERVSIEVQNRTLKIRPNRSAWGGYPGKSTGAVKLAVTTHELRGATVIGSGSLSVDKARAMKFDAAISGSGRIGIANVEADMLTLGLLGAGKLIVAGKVKSLRATVTGAGELDGSQLTAEDAEIAADTSGAIGLGVKRAVKLTATGAGDVAIAGTPACTVDHRGAGSISCGK